MCTECMRPPILLCSGGHSMCNICQPNVSRCPVCRLHTLSTRHAVLEKLAGQLNYPCVFQRNGCRDKYNIDLIGEHEEKCRYIQQVCLVQKLNLGTCTWTGIAGSMNTHLTEEHMDVLSLSYTLVGSHQHFPSFKKVVQINIVWQQRILLLWNTI
jgi:hypothetical protein